MNEIYKNQLRPIMWGWECGFKWTQSCSFQPVCPVSVQYLWFNNIYCLQIIFSQGDDESNRIIRMSPRNRNVGCWPQKLIFIWIGLMGQVFVGTLFWHVATAVIGVPGLEVFWHGLLLQRCGGGRAEQYICFHALFPLLLDDHVRVMLEETLIDHGDIANIITLQWWGRWAQVGAAFCRGMSFLFFLFLHPILPGHGGLGGLHGISEGHLLGLRFLHCFIPWWLRGSG